MSLHMMGLCILGQAFYMHFVQADMWLGNLLLERSDDIYRMKGILSVSGMPQRFVFQVFATLAYSLCSSIQSPVLPFTLVNTNNDFFECHVKHIL